MHACNKISVCICILVVGDSAELDIALETTWRQEVPGMALRMKRKLKMDKNFLDTAAAEVEKAYQAASERDRHRDL